MAREKNIIDDALKVKRYIWIGFVVGIILIWIGGYVSWIIENDRKEVAKLEQIEAKIEN